jgi:hypothetical protein
MAKLERVTEAQYVAACDIAAQVYRNQLKAAEGARLLAEKHGVNINSARDFIDDYRHLARGEVFQRAMSGAAMKHFMEQVAINEGPLGRANAIKSLQAHINYYEQGGNTTHMMRSVLSEFRAQVSGSEVDAVVESAVSDVDAAINPPPLGTGGQGPLMSAWERRLIEEAAMRVAEDELRRRGFSAIKDVSRTESYDFGATLRGEQWYVEMKGTTSLQAEQILLTANEVALHEQHGSLSCLIVVTGIVLDRAAQTATRGTPVVFMPWGTHGWNLIPTAYRAVRVTAPSE